MRRSRSLLGLGEVEGAALEVEVDCAAQPRHTSSVRAPSRDKTEFFIMGPEALIIACEMLLRQGFRASDVLDSAGFDGRDAPCGGLVNLRQTAGGILPGEAPDLLVAAGLELVAQSLVGEHALHGAHDVEDVFGIHHHGGVTDHFGQRTGVGGDDGRAMRHGFERREPESFVKRGKNEELGGVVEDAKNVDGNESEEAHVVLNAAADDGAAQVGMARDFVADDDQLEVGEEIFASEFGLQRGERLDDADEILVWADASGIEDERVGDLITLPDELALLAGGVTEEEALVDGVIQDLDAIRRNVEQTRDVVPGEVGDREDLRRMLQNVARGVKAEAPGDAAAI